MTRYFCVDFIAFQGYCSHFEGVLFHFSGEEQGRPLPFSVQSLDSVYVGGGVCFLVCFVHFFFFMFSQHVNSCDVNLEYRNRFSPAI